MAFDPDAYLAASERFDPDAYLSGDTVAPTNSSRSIAERIADTMGAPFDAVQEAIEKGGQALWDKALSTGPGRVAAEAAAGVNRGATGIADFLTTQPANELAALVGSDARVPSITDTLSSATTGNFMQDGLAKDVVREGAELIPAALGVGAALRTGAAALPQFGAASEGTAAGVLRQMGQSTAGQDAGYAALSGAGQAIGRDVGGEEGAMIGGMVAPLAPVAIRTAASSALRSAFGADDAQAVARTIDDFAAFGETPTVGMASGSRGIQGAENISGSALGGGPLARKSDAIARNMQRRLGEIADDISAREGAENAGMEIQRGLTGRGGFVDRFRARSAVLWNRSDELIDPEIPVQLNNTRNTLDRLVRGGNVGEILDNPRLVQLRQVLDETPEVDYQTMRDIRSSIGQRLASNDIMSDIPRAELRQIYGALSEDVRQVAAASGDDALAAFTRANTYTRLNHERIDSFIQPIANKVNPDEVFRAVAKGGEGVRRLNVIKRSLEPEQWDVVASNVVRRMGRSSSGQQTAVGDDATGDAFSIQKFVTDWDKLGPAKDVLFSGSPRLNQYGNDLNRIARAASTVKQASTASRNASGTAQSAAKIAAGTGLSTGVLMASPTILGVTAGTIAMNNAGARLMTNPNFVRWLAQTGNIPTSRAASAIGQLVNIADQSSADDAAVIQQLAEELEEE